MAETAALSPGSLPQSSTGRFDAMTVLLVAAHDEHEAVLGGGRRELSHAEIVDDEEG